MAQPTNLNSTYDLPNPIREDLQDVIYNIDPAETPFMSNVRSGSASQTYHEWQTDTLAAVSDNKVIEGNNPTGIALSDTTRLGNYTQISEKTVVISETDIAVQQAGITDRVAYDMAKKLKELKRDMEHACVGLNNAQVNTNEATAREFGSVQSFIATNDVFNSGGTPAGASPTGDGTDARTDSGTQQVFTEAMLESAVDLIWNSGGDPTMVLCGSFNKRKITGFTGNATRYKDADDRSVINAVDVYVSDYGELQIVPDRYVRTRDVLILDPDFWGLHYLRPVQSRELAKLGDNVTHQIIVEYTLAAYNEKSSGGVFDLTTS